MTGRGQVQVWRCRKGNGVSLSSHLGSDSEAKALMAASCSNPEAVAADAGSPTIREGCNSWRPPKQKEKSELCSSNV